MLSRTARISMCVLKFNYDGKRYHNVKGYIIVCMEYSYVMGDIRVHKLDDRVPLVKALWNNQAHEQNECHICKLVEIWTSYNLCSPWFVIVLQFSNLMLLQFYYDCYHSPA